MKSNTIPATRLHNQLISLLKYKKPHDVVAWLGAVQAQDYLGSLWAIALRTNNATEKDIEQAIIRKEIIRTWPMRGTLHFVAAEDIKWMLALMTPRVLRNSAFRRKNLEIDDEVLEKSKRLCIKALQGGKQLTRLAMYQVLEAGGIHTSGQRGLHIFGHLAQIGVLCFGVREGKQPTLTLLDEWAPHAKSLPKDEAVATLVYRYFTSHGPATVQDLMWWSGLTTSEIKEGIAMNSSKLASETMNNKTYWFSKDIPNIQSDNDAVYLLPAFDEYVVSYKDRSDVLQTIHKQHINPGNNGMLSPTIVSNGQVIGTWKRNIKTKEVALILSPFAKLTHEEKMKIQNTTKRYSEFLNLPVTIQ